MTQVANDLSKLAQKVWALPKVEVEHKKELIHEMIDSFKFKDKQEKDHIKVANFTKSSELDNFAKNLVLVDTDKVIK
jgi:hypothetical protein